MMSSSRKYLFKYKTPGQSKYETMEAKSTNSVKRILKLRDPSLHLRDIVVKRCVGVDNGYYNHSKRLLELGT